MYIECAKKVAEKSRLDRSKQSTAILNELLADEIWLAQVNKIKFNHFEINFSHFQTNCIFQLFKNVRCAWAEVDQIERQTRYGLLVQ